MSRSYETFRDGDSIDWHARGISDAEWQDAEDTKEGRDKYKAIWMPIEDVPYNPVIPPVTKDEGYNAFIGMTDEEVEQFKMREK